MRPPTLVRTGGTATIDFQPLPDKASVGRLRKQIRAELNAHGWTPSVAFDCLVAVSEACANALLHGTKLEGSEPAVGWAIDGRYARFVIRNHSARGWSRQAHPSGRETRLIDRSGGWGLELMRTLMDEVTIDVGPDGTEVTLLKRA